MKYINTTADAKINDGTVVVIGKFDGVHRGHRLLFGYARDYATKLGLKTLAFTFDRNIGRGKLITTNDERRTLIEESGMNVMVEYPFSKLVSMEACAFVREILIEKLNAKVIVAGADCGFGKNRAGNAELLKGLSGEYGYIPVIVPKITINGNVISSTYIRELIADGRIEEGNEALGYIFFLRGMVVRGNQLGRTWDFPTINILPDEDKLLPPNGVYASKVCVDGIWLPAVTNIGKKPTVDSRNEIVSVETYIFDYTGNLYDRILDVRIYNYIRPETKFDSFDELRKQISKDSQKAREYLSKLN